MSFSRRHFLVATAALAGTNRVVQADAPPSLATPAQVIGPFYPVVRPEESQADLTRVAGQAGRAKGSTVHVTCTVVDPAGRPIAGALVLVWQANAAGRYAHPRDTSTAPLDPRFLGHVLMRTDRQGQVRFLTIKPGAYADTPGRVRTPHIHFEVIGEDARLITQMYFPGEPLNASDRLLQELAEQRGDPDRLIATRIASDGGSSAADTALAWTVRLAGA
ncbi:MAG: protocatechuate 3,4-dioxygenase subunit beta [Xanthomonadales bacterium]|nr:protocatechuate 3,4-dioxygenase subunit beta [Xanthomonadales bacterium]